MFCCIPFCSMALRVSQSFTFCAAVFLLCICFPFLHNGSRTAASLTDRQALLAIKAQITNDPMLATSSWNDTLHFCQWRGVSCGRRHQRVTALNLQSLSLAGSVSPSIGNLSFLRNIDLSSNSFFGEIPHEISLLFRLQVLNLSINLLEGHIPANLSHCSKLRILSLEDNNFRGKVPMEFGIFSKLGTLNVGSNSLTGVIPPSLGNISSLQVLLMSLNMLEGSIPDSLGHLKSLRSLALSGNKLLVGTIPPSIFNISELAIFSLPDNQLQGSLPQNLGLTLPNLQRLLLWGNRFSGSIPVSLSNASKLEILDLSVNELSGKVPINLGNLQRLFWLAMWDNDLGSGEANDLNFISSLTNCSMLRILFLNGNNFAGWLPNSIANLSTKLETLSVQGNQIFGSIPTGIGNLVNLNSLDMHSNQFTGSIPNTIGLLHKLQEVGFGKNKLSGEIPSSIGNLTLLNQLWLEDNNLQGNIPVSLENCQFLVLLHLYGNQLNGTIPLEVFGLSSLSKSLNLAQNNLTGSIPSQVGNLKNLVELDVSHNQLSGEIPSSLGSCIRLEGLYMAYNSLNGTIPRSLSSLKGIEELDLSNNNFSGEIPKDLGTIRTFQNLNLSFNDLEGEVPTGGVFENASAVSISGNKKLCGGISMLKLPVCSISRPKKPASKLVVKIIIPIVCGILGIILISFLMLCWIKKKRNQPPPSASTFAFSLKDTHKNIPYQGLFNATNGFSSTNLIGMGSFGSVYRGILLDPNETEVAVKVLNLHNKGAFKSFMAECKALRNIRHRNLLKILTICSSIDFHGNDFKALVYEFMPNGSLETWLHGNDSQAGEGQHDLNLIQRLNIAIDVASALDYLHNHCQIQIIHCDLKPSNILLDVDMTAHVGDFGLARFLEQRNTEVSQSHTSSIGLNGTIGYAAPEYGMGSEVSTNGDVYSFGIVLLEMFTRKRPTDGTFCDTLNLHKCVEMALPEPERVMQIVDQVLLSGAEKEEDTSSGTSTQLRRWKIQECLTSILRIGVASSKESPRERINIAEATKELHFIKSMLLEN